MLESRENSPIPPEEIVDRLGKKFPNGLLLVYLSEKQTEGLNKNGSVSIPNIRENVRIISPADNEGSNSRLQLIRLFQGQEILSLYPYGEINENLMINAPWTRAVLRETNEGAVKYSKEHPEKLETETSAVLLDKTNIFMNKTTIKVEKEHIAGKLTIDKNKLLELGDLMSELGDRYYKDHIEYMRREFPQLANASDEEVENASPYLSSGMEGGDACSDGVWQFMTNEVKKLLISLSN